jgi:DNA-binding response OmpR family regulator
MNAHMKTVLVLDDNQDILDLLSTVLTDAGYDTILATGPDAIPANANVDLVITDLVPLKAYQRDTALVWVANLRARFAGAPVFVLTAHRAAAAEDDRLGANAIITKPFDVDALLARIDEHLS